MSQGFTKNQALSGSGAANRVAYWSAVNALSSSANLTWDGTDLALGSGNRFRMQSQNRMRHLNSLAFVTKTVSQTLSDATVTAITFNAEQHDTDGLHDNVTNNTRLTAPIAGKYLFTGAVRFDTNATGTRIIFLRVNGSTPVIRSSMVNAGSVNHTAPFISCVFSLAANDYVELTAFQDSGGNLSALGDDTQLGSTNFTMSYLGE